MNSLVALLVAFLAFVAAAPPTIYTDWTTFSARLPTDPSLVAFDDLVNLFFAPYIDGVGWGSGFPTYSFLDSTSGFSYSTTASGSSTNNLGPCTPDGYTVYQEAYAAGAPNTDGTVYYQYNGPNYPTLWGALVCSTNNQGCVIETDTITITVNGFVEEAAWPSTAGGECNFWGIEVDSGIQTLSFAGHQRQEFAAITNITMAIAVHPGGSQDPHFTGFQGEKYDFLGRANNWYSILSSPRLQMNALFESTCDGKPNNVMTAIAINSDGHKFFINSTREATVDGVSIKNLIPWRSAIQLGKEGTSGKIVHPWENWFQIQTSEFIITPTVHFPSGGADFKGVNCLKSYFNFDVSLLARGTYMHGVLGQSAQHDHTANAVIPGVEGDVEGTDSDYIVSGPWGTDSKFNVYKGPQ